MRDLADHLLDVLENSVNAGAGRVEVLVALGPDRLFSWEIRDDGHGLPEGDVTDPFLTTRRERRVGMGLALLRETAERSGGRLEIGPAPGGGTRLRFSTSLAHVDARPLGDLARALTDAALCWPGVALSVRLRRRSGGKAETILDTGALPGGRAALENRAGLYALLRRKREAAGIDTQFGT